MPLLYLHPTFAALAQIPLSILEQAFTQSESEVSIMFKLPKVIRPLSTSTWMMMCIVILLVSSQTFAQNDIPQNGVWGIAWSPDGTKLATANPSGHIYVRDSSGKTLLTLSGHKDRAITVDWSPDGRYLASGGRDDMIRIWDTINGSLVHEIHAPNNVVGVLKWQPTGNILISAGFDSFQAWSTSDWKPLTDSLGVSITDMSWSPDGIRFAFTATPMNVGIASIQPDSKIQTIILGEHTAIPYGVDWSPDGKKIVSAGGDDGSVRLWDVTSQKQEAILLEVKESVNDVAFDADSKKIVAVTSGGKMYIIDVPTQKIERTTTYNSMLWSVDWSLSSDQLGLAGMQNAPTSPITNQNQLQSQSQIEINAEQTAFFDILSP